MSLAGPADAEPEHVSPAACIACAVTPAAQAQAARAAPADARLMLVGVGFV